MTAGSSEYSIASKRGWARIASKRRRRNSAFSLPRTNVMCGVGLMNSLGSGTAPAVTRCAQNWRESWNCSLMRVADPISIFPSFSGV